MEQNYAFYVREIFAGNGQSVSSYLTGFTGCIGTYRYNRRDLPLNLSAVNSYTDASFMTSHQNNEMRLRKRRQNSETKFFNLTNVKGISQGCSQLPTCTSLPTDYCPLGQVCMDFWKGPFCVCGIGQHVALTPEGTLLRCNENAAVASLTISSAALIMILTFLMLLICKLLYKKFINKA